MPIRPLIEPTFTIAPCPARTIAGAIGRCSPGAQAATGALLRRWHQQIAAGCGTCRHAARWTPGSIRTAAAALLAGVQGGVGIMLATGDLGYLEAALDAGIDALRPTA
jgi:hypothetical protein